MIIITLALLAGLTTFSSESATAGQEVRERPPQRIDPGRVRPQTPPQAEGVSPEAYYDLYARLAYLEDVISRGCYYDQETEREYNIRCPDGTRLSYTLQCRTSFSGGNWPNCTSKEVCEGEIPQCPPIETEPDGGDGPREP